MVTTFWCLKCALFIIERTLRVPLMSSFENNFAWERSGGTSSRMGNVGHYRSTALLSTFESMRIRNSPFFFVATTMHLTHCVGSTTLLMAPLFYWLANVCFNCGFMLTGALHNSLSLSEAYPAYSVSVLLPVMFLDCLLKDLGIFSLCEK